MELLGREPIDPRHLERDGFFFLGGGVLLADRLGQTNLERPCLHHRGRERPKPEPEV